MRKSLLACALVLGLWPAAPADAGPIVVDAGWYGFCFGASGSSAFAGCQNLGNGASGNPFSFVAVSPVLFKITDAFDIGDRFRVDIDSGTFVFDTSLPGAGATTADPDLAFADPDYSKGSALLGAGAHTINVFSLISPFGGGGAYLEVESVQQVPEPGSLFLLGGGAVALLAKSRRRRAQLA